MSEQLDQEIIADKELRRDLDAQKGWGTNQHLDRGDNQRMFTTFISTFPDYLNSLDAIAEAER